MEISLLIHISLVLLSLRVLASLLRKLLRHPVTFPKDIPIVGVRKQTLSVARASLRQLTNGIATLLEGYHEVSLPPALTFPILHNLHSPSPPQHYNITSTSVRPPQQTLHSLRPKRPTRTPPPAFLPKMVRRPTRNQALKLQRAPGAARSTLPTYRHRARHNDAVYRAHLRRAAGARLG